MVVRSHEEHVCKLCLPSDDREIFSVQFCFLFSRVLLRWYAQKLTAPAALTPLHLDLSVKRD